MIIAIDGPAGAGKSTVAKIIAKRIGYLYLDTGAMYRALTLKVLQDNLSVKEEKAISELAAKIKIELTSNPEGTLVVLLNARDVSLDIRKPEITKSVSDIAKIKDVRLVMLEKQRELGRSGNVVLDGRDIGTVVFPNAEKKFYLDANLEERSRRRYKELKGLGQDVTLSAVDADLSNRDRIDSSREFAPLKKADDAIYIDTTFMSIEQVVDTLLSYING